MSINLAAARPGDEDKIQELLAELDGFYGDTPEGTPAERAAQVRAVLFAPQSLASALLAWDGDRLVGFAAYSFLWPAAGLSTSLFLKELYVADAYRRTGTGKLMMEELHRIAADRGCSRVEWTADSGNPGAQAFYQALGTNPKDDKIFYRVSIDATAAAASVP